LRHHQCYWTCLTGALSFSYVQRRGIVDHYYSIEECLAESGEEVVQMNWDVDVMESQPKLLQITLTTDN